MESANLTVRDFTSINRADTVYYAWQRELFILCDFIIFAKYLFIKVNIYLENYGFD